MTLPDIETRGDIDRLLVRFYEQAMVDPQIAHHFTELDLAHHLPIIGDFWEKLLFSRPVYSGNPLIIHQYLDARARLEPEHFRRWLEIFRLSVDSMFEGERANLAKLRAGVIADNLNQRLNPTLQLNKTPFSPGKDVRHQS